METFYSLFYNDKILCGSNIMVSISGFVFLSLWSLCWAAQKRGSTAKPRLPKIFNPLEIKSNFRGRLHMVKLECTSNPTIELLTCSYTLTSNTSGDLSVIADYKRLLASTFVSNSIHYYQDLIV
jgi:hypothetical protein